MTSPLRPLLLTFVILHSSFDIFAAAAPPPELTVLRTQYEKVLVERVTAPFEAAKGDLDAKFIAALDRAANDIKKTGDLDAVLAINADKKRLTEKLPLPEDDDATHDALKKLRGIYREQFKKLEDQRAASHLTILPGYADRLKALEATLTKADRIDEAKEVKDYAATLQAPPASTPASAEGKSAGASPTAIEADVSKLPKGDARKAAEWVFSIGGNVSLREKGKDIKVMKLDDLPKGKLTLVRIQLNSHFDGYHPITDADMSALARLPDLESLVLFELPLSDEACKFVHTCTKLRFFESDGCAQLTGAILPGMAAWKELDRLNIANSKNFRGENFEYLKRLPLKDLNVKNTAVNDEDLLVIAKIKALKALNLIATKVTDAGVAAFKTARPDVQITRQ